MRAGYAEYAKRLSRGVRLSLEEIPAPRHHSDHAKIKAQEAEKILARIGADDWVVALDEHGQHATSVQLAQRLKSWQMQRPGIVMVVGGADGLGDSVLARANECISLSKLTLPHYLVRVMLAEALYRADSINGGHPYHRT
jgi:23S rRNA (pseudouridine1915-N3)-methyltransferase